MKREKILSALTFTEVKWGLNTTLWSLHKALWSFMETRNICCKARHTLPTHWSFALLGLQTCSRTIYDASDWLVLTSLLKRCHDEGQVWHAAAHHFLFALLLRSLAVRWECKIYFSVSGRYTIYCGIQRIKITSITCIEAARCTLFVSFPTYLVYSVIFVNRVGVLLEQVHRTLKASEQFTPDFPSFLFIILPASCIKHHNHCNIHFIIWFDHKPASKSVVVTQLVQAVLQELFFV